MTTTRKLLALLLFAPLPLAACDVDVDKHDDGDDDCVTACVDDRDDCVTACDDDGDCIKVCEDDKTRCVTDCD